MRVCVVVFFLNKQLHAVPHSAHSTRERRVGTVCGVRAPLAARGLTSGFRTHAHTRASEDGDATIARHQRFRYRRLSPLRAAHNLITRV